MGGTGALRADRQLMTVAPKDRNDVIKVQDEDGNEIPLQGPVQVILKEIEIYTVLI